METCETLSPCGCVGADPQAGLYACKSLSGRHFGQVDSFGLVNTCKFDDPFDFGMNP